MPRRRKRVDLPDDLPQGERQALEQGQDAVSAIPDPATAGLEDEPPNPRRALRAPTERPREPLTAGMAFGEGPGPEALQTPENTLDPDDILSAARVPIYELMAAVNPNVSQRTKSAIRKMRSTTPPL